MCIGGQAFSSKRPAAEIERQRPVNENGRRDQANLGDRRVAEDRLKSLQIIRSAGGERARKVLVADEGRATRGESGVAEDMIGMFVRVYDVDDGLMGNTTDGGEKASADFDATAGVDHRDAAITDHEGEIGDVALVETVRFGDRALMREHAGSDLLQCEIFSPRRVGENQTKRQKPCKCRPKPFPFAFPALHQMRLIKLIRSGARRLQPSGAFIYSQIISAHNFRLRSSTPRHRLQL